MDEIENILNEYENWIKNISFDFLLYLKWINGLIQIHRYLTSRKILKIE